MKAWTGKKFVTTYLTAIEVFKGIRKTLYSHVYIAVNVPE
jgi:hypothetical protein